MLINDRHGNPVQLNHLYADFDKTEGNLPFPMNYTGGLCKVTDVSNLQEKVFLQAERNACELVELLQITISKYQY